MKTIEVIELRSLLEDAFPNSVLPSAVEDMKLGDIVEWDSLGNFNLLLAAEEKYSVKFEIEEMMEIKSMKQLRSVLENKL